MSGGSYNYLFNKDPEDLFHLPESLPNMFERLADLGYAEDAAAETEEICQIIKLARLRVGIRKRRLEEVWRAVEWWDSGDSGEDGLKKALARYREEGDT